MRGKPEARSQKGNQKRKTKPLNHRGHRGAQRNNPTLAKTALGWGTLSLVTAGGAAFDRPPAYAAEPK
jgi:hypothetical protein